jgi:hypothetical protein
MSVNARIIELNDDITSFMDHVNQFMSSKFLKFISILKKFDFFSSHLLEVEEQKYNSTEYDFLWKQNAQS